MQLSQEQSHIVSEFVKGRHIVTNAVAGAGKTTTLQACAASRPDARCLLLTYNKRLQLEVAERTRGTNVQVSTYHAAAGRAYETVLRNDRLFAEAVVKPPKHAQEFDVLMLDEAQDLIIEYYIFVCYLLESNPQAQLVVVGDERQAIGEYRGARPEFLTQAPEIFAASLRESPRVWSRCCLRESYRLTKETASFVNEQLFNEPNLICGRNQRARDRVRYHAVPSGEMSKVLGQVVRDAVREHGAENVFVLAPSVRDLAKKSSPLAILVKHHLRGILTYVTDGDSEVDPRASRGKLVIMSYNSSKGCERECVVLVGFDETFFEYYDRTWLKGDSLPNVLTVAATRAKKQLILVARADKTLRTVDVATLNSCATVFGRASVPKKQVTRVALDPKENFVSVKGLLRHLTTSTVREALKRIRTLVVPKDLEQRLQTLGTVHVPRMSAAKFQGPLGVYFETLSFIYGILAPVLAEVHLTGSTDFAQGLDSPEVVLKKTDPFSNTITKADYGAYPECFWKNLQRVAETPIEKRSHVEWATLAITSHAFLEGRHHIARQVTDYDWVDAELLEASCETVVCALSGLKGQFEVNVGPCEVKVGALEKQVFGRADFVDDRGRVWEFKLSDISDADKLQLACYLALRGGGEGFLLSLTRRTVERIRVESEDASELMDIIALNTRGVSGDIMTNVREFYCR